MAFIRVSEGQVAVGQKEGPCPRRQQFRVPIPPELPMQLRPSKSMRLVSWLLKSESILMHLVILKVKQIKENPADELLKKNLKDSGENFDRSGTRTQDLCVEVLFRLSETSVCRAGAPEI